MRVMRSCIVLKIKKRELGMNYEKKTKKYIKGCIVSFLATKTYLKDKLTIPKTID